MNKQSETATRAIVEEANEWLVRLQDTDVGTTDTQAFSEWLRRSPVHVREYLRAETVWFAMEGVDAERRIDVDALLSADDTNVIPIESAPPRVSESSKPAPTSPWRGRPFAAVAAAVAVTVLFTFVWYAQQAESLHYETGLGEQRRLVLADGSVIDMNTQSQIEVRLLEAGRYVDLLQGEALFTVAKDPTRPFVVESDLAIVRALGTQFNVYRLQGQTRVTVIEGRVSIENTQAGSGSGPVIDELTAARIKLIELTAGDQAEIVARAPIQRIVANTEKAVAWRERRLIFENQPLSEVVEEFNRYNMRQLTIRDPTLRDERISAVFDADQPDALVRFLIQNAPIEAIPEGDSRLVIQLRE